MVSQSFIEGFKNSMQMARNYTYDAEAAIDMGDIYDAKRIIASVVGHVINAQAVLAAKIAYELSEAEDAKKD